MADENGTVRRSISQADVQSYSPVRYVMGNIEPLNEWLQDKPFVMKFVNGCFRGFGQPIFLSNPISGVVILAALFVQNQWQAINGILGLLTALFTAILLRLDRAGIEDGSIAFNGLLVGLHIPLFSAAGDWYGYLVFAVILYSALSTLLASGLGNLCGQWTLPAFNLSFNITLLMYIAGTGSSNAHFPTHTVSPSTALEMWGVRSLDWAEVLQGIPKGIGQCYGCDDVITGSLIALAMLISSPIIFLHGVLGSLLGVFTGMALAAPPASIYAGAWGPNSVLPCASIGGFFYVLTIESHLLAWFAAICGALVSAGMGGLLASVGLPAAAFPFCFVSSMCLLINSTSRSLIRVPLESLTYPEDHRRKLRPNLVTSHGIIT
ncbi:urea transporter 1-like [Ptychodera flava]|uniref:urea transporter 1-like n=1 Tax=Ptychodera flava TaxID=63121 RepID=UPI003969E874